jgi:hypothetical protein
MNDKELTLGVRPRQGDGTVHDDRPREEVDQNGKPVAAKEGLWLGSQIERVDSVRQPSGALGPNGSGERRCPFLVAENELGWIQASSTDRIRGLRLHLSQEYASSAPRLQSFCI